MTTTRTRAVITPIVALLAAFAVVTAGAFLLFSPTDPGPTAPPAEPYGLVRS